MLFNQHLRPATRQAGMTLLELLVAIGLFMVVSGLGYKGLQATSLAKQQLTQRSQQLAGLQRSMLWLQRDIQNLIARPVRDRFGDPLPAFSHRGAGLFATVEMTRSGRINLANAPQSNLQRVRYHWTDEAVIRSYWPRLDRMVGTEPTETPLFLKATRIDWRYLDKHLRWHDQWPPPNYNGDSSRLIPRAVEVALEIPGYA
ncbi:MAG: type II secretion system minor pseudopilin GspJ, partial [Immundisolibacteraceae bacterium]|nr:type II secretion system minor pseudopilin GspJ [Immundisolibacteraceae bacterium]